MASVSDFLFNGTPPQSVTTYGTTTQNVPQWFSDFQQGIAAKGNAIASRPYQPYGGPRIAGFNADQNAAFGAVRAGQGAESGIINGAATDATQAGRNAGALVAASPWLARAGQAGYDTYENYMDPYVNDVVDRIGDLGARNLTEKFTPAINADFIRAGQYGSTGMINEFGKAIRDVSEGVSAEQNKALSQGFNSSMEYAAGDANRFGQIGQTAGNMSNMDTESAIGGAKAAGALGTLAQDARYKDADALGAVGNSQQQLTQSNLDLAFKDFQTQTNYQGDQLSWLNNLVKGFEMPISSTETKSAPLPGASYTPGALQQSLGAGLATYNLLR